FFFQAEDGIRDFHVTGVQTCALPIWRLPSLLTFSLPAPAPTGCHWLLTFPVTCGHFAEKAQSRISRLVFCKRKSKIVSSTFVYETVLLYEKENGPAPALDKRCRGCFFGSVAAGRSKNCKRGDSQFRPSKTRLAENRTPCGSP